MVQVTLWDIASLFGQIGLTSFGGGLSAWLYREVVGKRHWLPEEDFLGALTMAPTVEPTALVAPIAAWEIRSPTDRLASVTVCPAMSRWPMSWTPVQRAPSKASRVTSVSSRSVRLGRARAGRAAGLVRDGMIR